MNGRGFVVLFLLAGSAVAQFETSSIVRHMRVRVAFANGVCDSSTHVRLMGRGGPVADAATNDQCEVEFENVPAGTYHLNVSGQNFTTTDDTIRAAGGSADFEVKIKRPNDIEHVPGTPMSASVSTADLAIPPKAQKEFDKANDHIAHQDFKKAIEYLEKAIAIYPAYAAAYNNLAVVYARTGDREKEREALQKAIGINDHYAPAYVNLGRLDITAGDFSGAESAFSRATSYDPGDPMTLVLLTYSEFMDHHIDQAIATSRRAHTLAGPHAFVHQVAARAFEQKRDAASAIAELKLFLKEEPSGSRADIARKELASLESIRPTQNRDQ